MTERLPDLVADAPARPIIQTYAHPDGTTHLLLRFDGFVHNRGVGAFEMRGSQPVGTDMTAHRSSASTAATAASSTTRAATRRSSGSPKTATTTGT